MTYPFELCAFADEADAMIEGQVRALRENAIPWLELRGVDGKNVAEITPEEARAVGHTLADAGIQVWAIGSPTGKMDIAGDFGAHRDAFLRMLETARILSAAHYRLFSFYGVHSAAARDTALEWLSRLLEAGQGSGVVLCHENEKGILGEKADACLKIHKALPGLRAVFDPANFVQVGQDTLEAWEMLAPYVEYMHIKDALVDGTVVPAGCGAGHVRKILDRYGRGGGRVCTLEPHLAVFDGAASARAASAKAAALERGAGGWAEKEKYRYASARKAFDAAAKALREMTA